MTNGRDMTNGPVGHCGGGTVSPTNKHGNNKATATKLKKNKNKGQNEQKSPDDEQKSDTDISINLPGDTIDNESIKSINDLKAAFEQQIILLKGEINGLYNVVQLKDKTIGKLQEELGEVKNNCSFLTNTIGKLQAELGEVKNACNFLTEETTDLRSQIKINEGNLTSHNKKQNEVISKTVDLEDRSRRNNLLFFNIPEASKDGRSDNENCEEKIIHILEEKQFFSSDYEIYIDRAHRLGPKRNHETDRPRPIIVRFSYYKDKQKIITNGKKLKGTGIGVSEDFSKATVEEHKHLRRHAYEAKVTKFVDPKKAILNFRVTYRRVVLTYTTDKNNTNAMTFTKSFTLQYIQENPYWYIPQDRPDTRNNIR